MGFLVLTSTTQSNLVGEVQANLFNRTDLTNQRCVAALNIAQAQISRKHDFQELKGFYNVHTYFTSNAYNDKFIPLAGFIKHIHTVVVLDNTASQKLKHKPWRQFDREWPMPEALGRSRPAVYTRWGTSCIVYPVPQQVYPVVMRITNFPRPFDLTNGPGAVSDYEWKDDILIKLASAYLWKSYGRPDRADDFLAEANELFMDAVKQDSDEPDLDVNLDLNTYNLGNYWQDPFARTAP